jgi:hypothetical protein
MAGSFSGVRNRSIQKEPPTIDKQLVSRVECTIYLQSWARTHTVFRDQIHGVERKQLKSVILIHIGARVAQ